MFCDFCGGLLVVLGQLGNRVHLRCRSCGIDCSMNEAAYAEELQFIGRLAEEDAEPDMDDSLPGDFDEPYPSDSMDGDHQSALASAGMGTDEDYEHNLYDGFLEFNPEE